jgi:serine/threonine protein kinase
VLYDQCGTPAYIAPEVIKGIGYSGFASDMWSCGVVLYTLLYGSVPFKGTNLKELSDLITAANYSLKDIISKGTQLT